MKKLLLAVALLFILSAATSQNVSLNMLVLNSGVVPTGGMGTLQATVNATTGTAGQSTPVASGKINVQITVPPSLLISATQTGLPTGWTVRNNSGTVINICNSTATLAVNTAQNLLIALEGVTATTGSPTISGQISFRTNCSAPGSLAGDNPSDNTSQAGFIVTDPVPLTLTHFTATLNNCKPMLQWVSEYEINVDHFEVEKKYSENSAWVAAGVVTATGNNTNTKNKYSFTDNNITEQGTRVFYRLKIIDRDGKFAFSNIEPLFINCKTASVHVFPNPVTDGIINISVTGRNNNPTLLLFGNTGQVFLKSQLKDGNNKISINHIASGVYTLKIIYTNGIEDTVKKIIIN